MIDQRKDAFDKGEMFYETGVPCKRGHLSKRYVSTGQCAACQKRFAKGTDVVNPTLSQLLCNVHPDDVEKVKAYCDELLQGRRVPAPASNAAIIHNADIYNPINPATGKRFYDDPANAAISAPVIIPRDALAPNPPRDPAEWLPTDPK